MDETIAPHSLSVRISSSGADDQTTAALRAKDPVTMVIFGASGDLAKRKLVPALCQLERNGYLPERYAVIGNSRTAMTDEAYREAMRAVLGEHCADGANPLPSKVIEALYYQPGNVDDADAYRALRGKDRGGRERAAAAGQPALLSLRRAGSVSGDRPASRPGESDPPAECAGMDAGDLREAVRSRPAQRPRAHHGPAQRAR
jgi:hypothetical protein